MFVLYANNSASLALPVGSSVDFGAVTHQFFKSSCGIPTFQFNGTSLVIGTQGIYDLDATVSFTGAAGNATFQWEVNGVLVGPVYTETIGTATTESHTITVPLSVLVDAIKVLGVDTTQIKTVRLITGGVAITQSAATLSVRKVVGKGGTL